MTKFRSTSVVEGVVFNGVNIAEVRDYLGERVTSRIVQGNEPYILLGYCPKPDDPYGLRVMPSCVMLPAGSIICRNNESFSYVCAGNYETMWEKIDDEPKIDLLAKRLAGAEVNYRHAYVMHGGGHETGRYWEALRHAGDAIRQYFSERED